MFHAREDLTDFFEKGIFPFKGNVFKRKEEEESKEESKEEKLKKYIINTFTFIEEKSRGINNDLFQTYFSFLTLIDLAKKLFEIKDAKKNSQFAEEIKNRWSKLKDETEKISEEEIKNEKPNQILKIANKIFDFNKDIQKQQKGSGLKILTPNQMLSRL